MVNLEPSYFKTDAGSFQAIQKLCIIDQLPKGQQGPILLTRTGLKIPRSVKLPCMRVFRLWLWAAGYDC